MCEIYKLIQKSIQVAIYLYNIHSQNVYNSRCYYSRSTQECKSNNYIESFSHGQELWIHPIIFLFLLIISSLTFFRQYIFTISKKNYSYRLDSYNLSTNGREPKAWLHSKTKCIINIILNKSTYTMILG